MKLGIWVCVVMLALQGCSLHRAANQPDKLNLDLLQPGTHRAQLIAEFGSPAHSETRDGKRQDIFRFVQGYSTAAKSARAVGHGTASVLTLGLWEVVGTPVEGAFDGTEMAYLVIYDAEDVAEQVMEVRTD